MDRRIICLDIGDARIGVAVSDPAGIIAAPLDVIHRIGWGPDCRKIKMFCDQYDTDTVVAGLPLNMDGSEGCQARKVKEFCSQLEKHGLKILFQDERLTTVTAEESLLEDGMSREKRKKNVDKIAASIILQQWLNENGKN